MLKKIEFLTFGFILLLLLGFLTNIFQTQSSINSVTNSLELNSLDRSNWFWDEVIPLSDFSTQSSFAPCIKTDSKNNIHVFWNDNEEYLGSDADHDIYHIMWNDTTNSWSDIELISTESTGHSAAPVVAIDANENIFVTWYDVTDYLGSDTDSDIFFKKWISETESWSTTEVVSTESTSVSYYPDIGIDGLGNIHISWHDRTDYKGAGGIDDDIFYKQWFSSNSSWSDTDVISIESTDDSIESKIAVDELGNVYVVWHDQTDNLVPLSGTDTDVYLRQKTFGEQWSALKLISSDSTGVSYAPDIVCNNNGDIHISWSDNTDIFGADVDEDIFYKSFNSLSQL